MPGHQLKKIERSVTHCELCPRLRKHCEEIARVRRRSYQDQKYWGRAVSGFGDEQARLLIVGLAPAAHGANRTGRMFTGDRSGEWLYRALHRAGFANQPHAVSVDDGLQLRDAYVTSVVKCAPPDNKPTPTEISRCRRHLEAELEHFSKVRVFLALGGIALQGLWPHLVRYYGRKMPRPRFGHGNEVVLPDGKVLLLSYHPSQQNTFTGRLTEPMLDAVFSRARELIGADSH